MVPLAMRFAFRRDWAQHPLGRQIDDESADVWQLLA